MSVMDEYGGYWGEHPKYRLRDWRYQVAHDDTRLGYWDWVEQRVDDEAEPSGEARMKLQCPNCGDFVQR